MHFVPTNIIEMEMEDSDDDLLESLKEEFESFSPEEIISAVQQAKMEVQRELGEKLFLPSICWL